jgi:hypothetical protein
MHKNLKASALVAAVMLMTSACASGGETADKYASILSSHKWKIDSAAKNYYAMAYSLDPSTMEARSIDQVLSTYEYKEYVDVCAEALKDLEAIGSPDKEIADLVSETKDAFELCQTAGSATSGIDFANKYLADSENIMLKWIPYGVPE